MLNWFENYLYGRSQRVALNGQYSDWKEIRAGVPQGSILGPLLFLIYINDIINDIDASIKLFADDTSIYLEVDNPSDSAEILNRDIEKIHKWSEKWLVKFNPSKTETMTVSRKQVKPIHPPLKMNCHVLQEVYNHKHLGIILSSSGTWHEHIEYIVKKSYSRLNVLRKLRYTVNRHILEKIYMCFIRPILEYGDVVWDCQNLSLINKVENVQLEAARIVTGGTKFTSLQKLYDETGWEKLSSRREKHRLILLHKIINKETPSYLQDIIPDIVANRHRHDTRQAQNLSEIRTRTNYYSDYFLPSTVKSWNILPLEVRNSRSQNIFKAALVQNSKKIPYYYNTGSRMGQIYHSRLRMSCSSLNDHLFVCNLTESPYCLCGSRETTTHFLLHCHRYHNLRLETIFSLNYQVPVDTNLLLYGSDVLDYEQNKQIFMTVQKFILSSKRFTN